MVGAVAISAAPAPLPPALSHLVHLNPTAAMLATRVILIDLETAPAAMSLLCEEGDFVLGFCSEA